MIVKDEAACIRRCLESALPVIDSWAITDTGSSDGTMDLIREILGHLPGVLSRHPFVNFAASRNQALEYAQMDGASHILFLDADDYLIGSGRPTLDTDIVDVEVRRGNIRYTRPAIVRAGLRWEWRGVLHEALYGVDNPTRRTTDAFKIQTTFDGTRSSDPLKYHKDAATLQQEVDNGDTSCRTLFYLAQSLRDAGETATAQVIYQQRADRLDGWDEETYVAQLWAARLAHANNLDPLPLFLRAYWMRPSRPEAARELSRFFGRAAIMNQNTRDALFVEMA
jgi:glycosyltransferase involved in cell wall biosynthesis